MGFIVRPYLINDLSFVKLYAHAHSADNKYHEAFMQGHEVVGTVISEIENTRSTASLGILKTDGRRYNI